MQKKMMKMIRWISWGIADLTSMGSLRSSLRYPNNVENVSYYEKHDNRLGSMEDQFLERHCGLDLEGVEISWHFRHW